MSVANVNVATVRYLIAIPELSQSSFSSSKTNSTTKTVVHDSIDSHIQQNGHSRSNKNTTTTVTPTSATATVDGPTATSVQFSEIRSSLKRSPDSEARILDTVGIRDPLSGRPLTVGQAIQMRILDVRTGQLAINAQGERVDLPEAVRRGLIDGQLAANLLEPGAAHDPATGRPISLLEVIQKEILEAESGSYDSTQKRIKVTTNISAIEHQQQQAQQQQPKLATRNKGDNVVDDDDDDGQSGRPLPLLSPNKSGRSIAEAMAAGVVDSSAGTYRTETGTLISISEAYERGFLVRHEHVRIKATPMCLTDAITQGLVDSSSGWLVDRNSGDKFRLDSAIANGLLSANVREVVDAKRDAKVTVSEALEAGILNAKTGRYAQTATMEKLTLADARQRQLICKPLTLKDVCDLSMLDAKTGQIYSPMRRSRLGIREAMEAGVLDADGVKSVTVTPGELVTLTEALRRGVILAEVGKYRDLATKEEISIPEAVDRGLISTVSQRSIFNIDGFKDPHAEEFVSMNEAIGKNILCRKAGAFQLDTGKGVLIALDHSVEDGFVRPEVFEMLSRKVGVRLPTQSGETTPELTVLELVYHELINPKTGYLLDPRTKAIVPLDKAIESELITPEGALLLSSLLNITLTTETVTKTIKRYVTMTGDLNASGSQMEVEIPTTFTSEAQLTFTDAVRRGLIDETQQMFQDPSSGKVYSVQQALNYGLLAPDSDGPVPESPVSASKPKTTSLTIVHKKIIPAFDVTQVAQLKSLSPQAKTIEFINTERAASLSSPTQSMELPAEGLYLSEAIAHKLFDPHTGLFTIRGTDRLVSFEECIKLKIINPRSVTVLDKQARKLSVVRAFEKRIIDATGNYKGNDVSVTMPKAIEQGLIILESRPIDTVGALQQRLIKITKLIGQPDIVEVSESNRADQSPVFQRVQVTSPDLPSPEPVQLAPGIIYDPSTALVIFTESGRSESILAAVQKGLVDASHVQITDPKTGNVITIAEALASGVIDAESHSIVDSSGKHVDIINAVKYGLLAVAGSPLVAAAGAINSLRLVLDPQTGEQIPIELAFERGLVSQDEAFPQQSTLTSTISSIRNSSVDAHITDPRTGETMNLEKAVELGLISATDAEKLLQSETDVTTITDPLSGEVVTVEQSLQRGLISADHAKRMVATEGSKFSATTTYQVQRKHSVELLVKDPHTGEEIAAEEAVRRGLISAEQAEKLIASAGPMSVKSSTDVSNVSNLIQAITDTGIVSPEQAQMILSQTNVNVTITDPQSQSKVPLTDALRSGLITPEQASQLLVSAVQDSSKSPSNIMSTESIDLSQGPSDGEQTRSRVTTEPKFQVTIGRARASSISPDKEAKPVILQKMRKKVVRPKDAFTKGLIDASTAAVLDDRHIVCSNSGDKLTLAKALQSQNISGSDGKIIDPQRGDVLNFSQAMERGILEAEGTNELLVPLNKSLSLPQVVQQGLVEADCFIHPETGASLSLREAIVCEMVDPFSRIVEPTGQIVTIASALEHGTVNEHSLQVQTRSGSVDLLSAVQEKMFAEESQPFELMQLIGMTFPVALKRGLIDVDRKELVHPITTNRKPISEAIDTGLIMALPYTPSSNSVTIDQALSQRLISAENCTFREPVTGKVLPIDEAIENGHLVVKSLSQIINSHISGPVTSVTETVSSFHTVTTKTIELLTGYALVSSNEVENVQTGERFTLEQAKLQGIIQTEESQEVSSSVRETKLNFTEAIKRGLIDIRAGTFTDPTTGVVISIQEAVDLGVLTTQACGDDTDDESTEDKVELLTLAEAVDNIYDAESKQFRDPKNPKRLVDFADAVHEGILDAQSVVYDIQTGKTHTLEEGIKDGFIDAKTGEVNSGSGSKINVKDAAKMGLLAVVGAPILAGLAVASVVKKVVNSKSSENVLSVNAKSSESSVTVSPEKRPVETLHAKPSTEKPSSAKTVDDKTADVVTDTQYFVNPTSKIESSLLVAPVVEEPVDMSHVDVRPDSKTSESQSKQSDVTTGVQSGEDSSLATAVGDDQLPISTSSQENNVKDPKSIVSEFISREAESQRMSAPNNVQSIETVPQSHVDGPQIATEGVATNKRSPLENDSDTIIVSHEKSKAFDNSAEQKEIETNKSTTVSSAEHSAAVVETIETISVNSHKTIVSSVETDLVDKFDDPKETVSTSILPTITDSSPVEIITETTTVSQDISTVVDRSTEQQIQSSVVTTITSSVSAVTDTISETSESNFIISHDTVPDEVPKFTVDTVEVTKTDNSPVAIDPEKSNEIGSDEQQELEVTKTASSPVVINPETPIAIQKTSFVDSSDKQQELETPVAIHPGASIDIQKTSLSTTSVVDSSDKQQELETPDAIHPESSIAIQETSHVDRSNKQQELEAGRLVVSSEVNEAILETSQQQPTQQPEIMAIVEHHENLLLSDLVETIVSSSMSSVTTFSSSTITQVPSSAQQISSVTSLIRTTSESVSSELTAEEEEERSEELDQLDDLPSSSSELVRQVEQLQTEKERSPDKASNFVLTTSDQVDVAGGEKMSLGNAIDSKKIQPSTCRIVYNNQQLDQTVQTALNQGDITNEDTVEVYQHENLIVLLENESKLTFAETLSIEHLTDIGAFDPKADCFVDTVSGDRISFATFAYEMNIIDPEQVYVKDLSQSVFEPLYEALARPLIDKNTGHMVDSKTGQRVPFFECIRRGWIIQKPDSAAICLQNVDPNTGTIVQFDGTESTISEAINSGQLDVDNMSVRDPRTGEILPMTVAIERGVVLLKRGVIVNTLTGEETPLAQALNENLLLAGVRKPISLEAVVQQGLYDAQTGRILDTVEQVPVTIVGSITKGIVDPDISLIRDTRSMQLSTLTEALEEDLIDSETGTVRDVAANLSVSLDVAVTQDLLSSKPVTWSLVEVLEKQFYNPESGKVLQPHSGTEVTLAEAVASGFVDVTTTLIKDAARDQTMPAIRAIESGLLNTEQGRLTAPDLTLDQALQKGYILTTTVPLSVLDLISRHLYDPLTGLLTIEGKSMTLEDAISSALINPGELVVRDPISGNTTSLLHAISAGTIDARAGIFIDPHSGLKMSLQDALEHGLLVPFTRKCTLPDAVYKGLYDPRSGTFANSATAERLSTDRAIKRGIIDPQSTIVNVAGTVLPFELAVERGIVNARRGTVTDDANQTIDFREAFERGILIEVQKPISLSEALLKGLYDEKDGKFMDACSGERMTVAVALERGLIDRNSVQMKDLRTGKYKDIDLLEATRSGVIVAEESQPAIVVSGTERLGLQEAFDMGLLADSKAPISIQRAIHQGLYDDKTGKLLDQQSGRQITLFEATRRFTINPQLPCYFNERDEQLYSLADTCRAKIIDRREGVFREPGSDVFIPLSEAMALGLIVDIETAGFGLYETLAMGFYDKASGSKLFVHPVSGRKMTLRQAGKEDIVSAVSSLVKDHASGKYLRLDESIAAGLIDDLECTYILPTYSIDLQEARKRGLIVTTQKLLSVEKAVRNQLFRPETGRFVDPSTGTYHDLKQAIIVGLIDADSTAFKNLETGEQKPVARAIDDGDVDVAKGRVLDPKTKRSYNYDVALANGLLVTVDRPITGRLRRRDSVDVMSATSPTTKSPPREMTVDEAIRYEIIDPHHSVVKNPATGQFEPVQVRLDAGTVDAAMRCVIDPKVLFFAFDPAFIVYVREPLSFDAAIESGSLNLSTGKFTIRTTGSEAATPNPAATEEAPIVLSLKDAIGLGHIDPETALIKDGAKKKLLRLPEAFRKGLVDADKANVLDTSTSKLHSLEAAVEMALVITPKRAIGLLEALTYNLYNPTTGTFADPFRSVPAVLDGPDRRSWTLSAAISAGHIDPSTTVVRDVNSASIVPLVAAIASGLVDAEAGRLNDGQSSQCDLLKARDRGLLLAAEQRVSLWIAITHTWGVRDHRGVLAGIWEGSTWHAGLALNTMAATLGERRESERFCASVCVRVCLILFDDGSLSFSLPTNRSQSTKRHGSLATSYVFPFGFSANTLLVLFSKTFHVIGNVLYLSYAGFAHFGLPIL